MSPRLRTDGGTHCLMCGQPAEMTTTGAYSMYCSERCRKRRYDRACIDCGALISGTDPGTSTGRCYTCATDAQRVWTPDAIVASLQDWSVAHGGLTPTANEFGGGRRDYPTAHTVQRVFGSWAAGVRAAGFEPFRVGERRHIRAMREEAA